MINMLTCLTRSLHIWIWSSQTIFSVFSLISPLAICIIGYHRSRGVSAAGRIIAITSEVPAAFISSDSSTATANCSGAAPRIRRVKDITDHEGRMRGCCWSWRRWRIRGCICTTGGKNGWRGTRRRSSTGWDRAASWQVAAAGAKSCRFTVDAKVEGGCRLSIIQANFFCTEMLTLLLQTCSLTRVRCRRMRLQMILHHGVTLL